MTRTTGESRAGASRRRLRRSRPVTASPQAYPDALLWRAVGSNPPGAKAPGYASWAHPPVFPPIPGEQAVPVAAGQAPFDAAQVLAAVPAQRGPATQPHVPEDAKETAQ